MSIFVVLFNVNAIEARRFLTFDFTIYCSSIFGVLSWKGELAPLDSPGTLNPNIYYLFLGIKTSEFLYGLSLTESPSSSNDLNGGDPSSKLLSGVKATSSPF